jgi:hypothetical protein
MSALRLDIQASSLVDEMQAKLDFPVNADKLKRLVEKRLLSTSWDAQSMFDTCVKYDLLYSDHLFGVNSVIGVLIATVQAAVMERAETICQERAAKDEQQQADLENIREIRQELGIGTVPLDWNDYEIMWDHRDEILHYIHALNVILNTEPEDRYECYTELAKSRPQWLDFPTDEEEMHVMLDRLTRYAAMLYNYLQQYGSENAYIAMKLDRRYLTVRAQRIGLALNENMTDIQLFEWLERTEVFVSNLGKLMDDYVKKHHPSRYI